MDDFYYYYLTVNINKKGLVSNNKNFKANKKIERFLPEIEPKEEILQKVISKII